MLSRSAFLVAAPGIAVFFIVAIAPLVVLMARCVNESSDASSDVIAHPATLLCRSIAWALIIAVLSTALGWIPGRALRRCGWLLRCITFAAALIPAYALFYCWWRVLRPGNAIADYAMTHDLIEPLRAMTLAFALIAWHWPICACFVALRESSAERLTRTMLLLDGGSARDRFAAMWRADRVALACAAVAIALVLLGETTAFDAAQIATFAAELRALDAAGATPRAVFIAAIPTLVVTVIASAAAAILLIKGLAQGREVGEEDLAELACHGEHSGHAGQSKLTAQRLGAALTVLLVMCGSVVPIAMLASEVGTSGGVAFNKLHARGAFNALGMAAVSGVAGGLFAVAAASMMMSDARRALAGIFSIALLWIALPATLVALATAELWRSTSLTRTVYDSAMVVSCAEAARFSAVAMAIGIWCGAGLAQSQKESWMVHGRTLGDFLRMARPILTAAFAGGFLVTLALAATETAVAARLAPPGIDWIAGSLLNAIHYQDPTAVSAVLPWMALLAVVCASVALVMMRGISRRTIAKALMIALVVVGGTANLVACGASTASESAELDDGVDSSTPRLPTDVLIGRSGRTDGRFQTPRALAVEAGTGSVFVVDRSGRVQRFSKDGTFELSWSMPKFDKGKPTGISIGLDGLIYVADTHEHQVLVFNREGHVVGSFGSYGQGPGQFVYPTDVAFAPDGRIFVSEFGGNDRIQVFDTHWKFLKEFGEPGQEPGMFARPQSIAFSRDGSELFVADACNHRIQVFGDSGELKRVLGDCGREPGKLAYPYGLDVLDDGTLLVCEFGNCRIQRLNPRTGDSLGIWGGGGHATGRFDAPWSVQCVDGRVFVIDSSNGRVQSCPIDSLGGTIKATQ